MSTKSLPATLAQFQAMRDLAIPYDADHPPTFDEAAKLLSEKIRGTPADRSEGWPVPSSSPIDDLREAVRPRPLRPEALVVGPAQAVNIRRALGGDINHARDDRADFDRRYPVHPAQGIVNDESVTMDPKTQGALSKGLLPLTKSNREILEAAFRSYRKDARPDAQEGEDDAAWLHFFEHVRKVEEAERPLREIKPDDGRNGLPLGFFDDGPFVYEFTVYEFTDANGPMSCHPASGVGPLTLHVKRPHVATLPDGRAVNLPAGTVLREGALNDPPMPTCVALDLALDERGIPNLDPAGVPLYREERALLALQRAGRLYEALDLLRHARPWITDDAWSANEPPATMTRAQVAALRAEVDAFLAGMPIVSEGSR